jgi:hypothetical protein
MNLSEFEKMVLGSLIENDPEKKIMLCQLRDVTVLEREYTGVGLHTKFQVSNDSPLLSKSNRYIEDAPKTHLGHPELKHGAGVILWINSGKISMLECYTYDGDWPKNESLFTISA